jgi:DNA-directed RNA polymerase specialized sigma24 family protein
MSDVNFEKHYAAFKWAVSTDWKDKNELYSSIQYKIFVLKNEYELTDEEIVNELFEAYWERGHYRKFDETKGSLNNWIARYVWLYLNNLLRKYAVRAKYDSAKKIDPLDQRNWANLEWINRDNEKEDLDYQPEIVFDPTNPEDLCIAKETMEFISGHFSENEVAYLMGEIELDEAAALSGCSASAFRKSLERRRADFRNAMKAAECS